MSRTSRGKSSAEVKQDPQITTYALPPTRDGRTRSIDGAVWAWRRVPLGQVRDTKDDEQRLITGARLVDAFDGLARMTSTRSPNRRLAKGSYREVHLLSLNVPTLFRPPMELPQARDMLRYFGDRAVPRRIVLLGVRLQPDSGIDASHGVRGVWDSVVDTFFSGERGAPMREFDRDHRRVGEVLAHAGLSIPAAEELRFADAWWNYTLRRGAGSAELPYVMHVEHMHTLRTPEIRRAVQRAIDAGHTECADWSSSLRADPDLGGMTFAAVDGFEFPEGVEPARWQTLWGLQMMERGALAISVRGLVEPARLTAKELKRLADRHDQDEAEHQSVGRTTGARAERHRGALHDLARAYELGQEPPTLIDTRITVCFDGVVEDVTEVAPLGVRLDPLTNKQAEAWAETMIGSPVRGNPQRLDVSSELVAHSGLSSLQTVGDDPVVTGRDGQRRPVGAMLGFSEQDHVPVWVTGSPQAKGDNLPLFGVAAGTGAGKLLPLDTPVLTPDGTRPIGEVRPGDLVLARDGRAYPVTFRSPVDPSPALCTITLSDGQQVDACLDHQWIVRPPAEHHRPAAALRLLATHIRRAQAGWQWGSPVCPESLYDHLIAAVPVAGRVWPSIDVFRAGLGVVGAADVSSGAEFLRRIAARLTALAQEQDALEDGEEVLTTAEMIALGGTGFRIRAMRGTPQDTARLTALLARTDTTAHRGRSVLLPPPGEHPDTVLRTARRAGVVARIEHGAIVLDHDETHLTITSITPTASRPGVCISVASPDRSYVCADGIPTHNTQVLFWLAWQWQKQRSPQVIINPKQGSDHSPFVRNVGGTVVNLDELEESDGALDPLRWSTQIGDQAELQARLNVGGQLAGDMIARASPWGPGLGKEYRTEITNGIQRGVEAGARATGEALRWAVDRGVVRSEVAAKVFEFADSYPLFRACFGYGTAERALSIADGMTLFQVGRSQFEMPASTSHIPAEKDDSEVVRLSANIMRMLTRACTANLQHRDAKIHFDEAWVLEKLAPSEGEQLGRLAREMGVLVCLYTQTASGFVATGLDNYIGRGLLGFMESPKEADAAIELFKLGGNPEIRHRLGEEAYDMNAPDGLNYASLKALRTAGTNTLARGSVFYYIDEYKRVAPVEVVLPEEFLEMTSTNPDDIRARRSRQRGAT